MAGLVRVSPKLSLQTLFGFEFLLPGWSETDPTARRSQTSSPPRGTFIPTSTSTSTSTPSTMPTHYLKITTPMVCGGCTGTIEKALMAVPGVSGVSVSLNSKAAQVHTTKDEMACKCTVCNCGPKCECMAKSLVAAVAAVGFEGTMATETDFTCGTTSTTAGSASSCGNADCTCGPNCQCGSGCQCAGCPGSAPRSNFKSLALAYATPTNLAISVALISIGWMAATKFAK